MMSVEFQDFWNQYPKKTAIAAARRSFLNQIFLHGAKPEQMVNAAKIYAEINSKKDTTFLPNPSRFLDDQVYLDTELNPPAPRVFDGGLQGLANILGDKFVQAWCVDFTDGVLKITKPRLADWFRNKYEAKLMMAGVREVV